ncbi:MAG TPA: NAD(P)-dependent oxidoreductase [Acidimicrobiales bacterium]|nr:NAD(P)-dependent oxidoreductase [Acidimicrobiales bacterium]
MKVFVSGSTGVAGRSAVPALVAAGHEVTAAVRSEAKAHQARSSGATPLMVDLFDADAVRAALDGHEAVCNLATHIPPFSRAGLPGAWKENDRIRREVSANIARAAVAAGVAVWVQESVSFVYADHGDAWITESVAPGGGKVTESSLEAEANARGAEAGGVRPVVLRFAQFYGAGTVHSQAMFRMARRRLSPIVGRPEAYLSSIHTDDLGPAIAAALDAPAGTYNVVDDQPVTRRELRAMFESALGRRLVQMSPGMSKLGGSSLEPVSRSLRMSNKAFKDATGWAPTFVSCLEGWPAVIDTLRGRGG